jgi:hypothetical protein
MNQPVHRAEGRPSQHLFGGLPLPLVEQPGLDVGRRDVPEVVVRLLRRLGWGAAGNARD